MSDFVQDESKFFKNLIYVTLHGSQAYGLNTEYSDTDVKGIIIPPRSVQEHLFHGFEQVENSPFIEKEFDELRNPNNPKYESTIYSLRKFFKLAADVNPNVIELLYTDKEDQMWIRPSMDKLMENRDKFLSSKAKFTFTGYAVAQLARINRHRKWIENPVTELPKRSDYGLPEEIPVGVGEVQTRIQKVIDSWSFAEYGLDDLARNELKDKVFEVINHVSDKTLSWDNWPEEYWTGALKKLQSELNLREEVIAVITKENEYRKALNNYKSYLTWEKSRNPERKALEAKYKYDVKHAMHLVRLLNMGHEVLTQGKIIVKRPDRELLMEVRNGGWTYDKVIEYSEEMKTKIEEAYINTSLPRSVDHIYLNNLYHEIYEGHVNGLYD